MHKKLLKSLGQRLDRVKKTNPKAYEKSEARLSKEYYDLAKYDLGQKARRYL